MWDGSWWMQVAIVLIVRFQGPSGRLTAEPEPVLFWAPMADGVVTPIEGENYSAIPTTRDPSLLRQQARTRATGQRRRPRDEWA